MKILVIHGQNHKGSTYMIAKKLVEAINFKYRGNTEIKEYFLPKDFDEPCMGCYNCFNYDLSKCPHYDKLMSIETDILEADLLIFESPVYVYHATGQMMSLLNHFGTWWIIHRPRIEMTKKQAVVISTAAGGGMKSTIKDIADSLEMWGISKIYKYGVAVQAGKPEDVPARIIRKIDKKIEKLSSKILASKGKRNMNIRAKKWFYLMRFAQKHFMIIEPDYSYWKDRGWHGKARPWKKA